MEKGKTRLRWVGAFAALAVIMCYGVRAQGAEKSPDETGKARADVISIDSLKVFGDLEKPEVIFFHDRHTDALEAMGQDCSACHLVEDTAGNIPGTFHDAVDGIDRLSPKFKRLKDTARQEVMDVYHKFCIECHADMAKADQKTGPVDCGSCHQGDTVASSQHPVNFNKALHQLHIEAEDNRCESCHHVYDANAKKLVPGKGQEKACRHCHQAEEGGPVLSLRQASHQSCIDCHRQIIAEIANVAPVKCSGCHDPEKQKDFRTVSPVARLDRNQPDSLFVSTGLEESDKMRMCPVPFDHKAHEGYTDNCRVCHHADMDRCSKCHTLAGSPAGGGINLETAMHDTQSQHACIGCHNEKLNDEKCAGCHAVITDEQMTMASCEKCHMKSGKQASKENGWSKSCEKGKYQTAEEMLKSRKAVTTTYGDQDIPENVVIKGLAKKYEPVEFPHRQIVKALMKDIESDKLAAYFHSDEGTVCRGCHHNSPSSTCPPSCASCHSVTSDKTSSVPNLLEAYHQQCIDCHANMGMKNPGNCTDCHKDFTEKHADYKM